MDGSTLVLATVGDPVVQVQTPGRMPELFAERNINATWVPLHVKAANLPVVVAMLRQVENYRTTPRALVSGSLNLVRREADGTLTGDMVDGLGFVRGLATTGRNVAGKEAWLVGAGGAGAAIAAALCESGIGCLWLKDAVSGRAEELADRLQHHFSEMRIGISDRQPDRIDYVINATPLGLRPDDPLPFDISGLPASAVVCDIIMKPARTALLQAAEARGLATHPGTPMLTAALPLYLEFFGLSG
jgi:shikimate dehydrogenase